MTPSPLGNLATVETPALAPLNLDREEAAKYLGISIRTLANLRTDRKLLPVQICGRVLYPRTVLDEFQSALITAAKAGVA